MDVWQEDRIILRLCKYILMVNWLDEDHCACDIYDSLWNICILKQLVCHYILPENPKTFHDILRHFCGMREGREVFSFIGRIHN